MVSLVCAGQWLVSWRMRARPIRRGAQPWAQFERHGAGRKAAGTVKGGHWSLCVTRNTNRSYTTSSNDSGYYAVVEIFPPGHYELTTAFKGFVTNCSQKASTCRSASFATIDVTLEGWRPTGEG